MQPWFKVRKAAQVAAYFARRQGGAINLMKLVKLVYLANRNAMAQFDYPIFDDHMVSMPHGPVDSFVLNYLDGAEPDRADWEAYLTARANYMVGLAKPDITEDELDELSNADLGVLSKTWDDFGHLNQWQLEEYTHNHCQEWEDPNGSSWTIPYARVFKALGKERHYELARMILQQRQIATALSGK
jgi:uncharacterized phage-associated protein